MLFILENISNFFKKINKNPIQQSSSSFIRGIFFSKLMGGVKKTTSVSKDKSAGTKDTKKNKKDKGDSGPKKAEITVMVNEQQAMKIIQCINSITQFSNWSHSFSRHHIMYEKTDTSR